MGYDSGDDVETIKREALARGRTMGTSRRAACDPTHSVDRDHDATNFCDMKTRLERLELVEQGLSKLRGKLRAQPWLTDAD